MNEGEDREGSLYQGRAFGIGSPVERKASHALKVVLKRSLAVTKTKETICPSFQNLSPYETQKLKRTSDWWY
ncbi:MAG: hypothetical protein GF308_08215 [Candidatus Heimdallarchaeota archaeon]|nr:hypothetical protein [Candidatus Heimdallarchaeota archaeon]